MPDTPKSYAIRFSTKYKENNVTSTAQPFRVYEFKRKQSPTECYKEAKIRIMAEDETMTNAIVIDMKVIT